MKIVHRLLFGLHMFIGIGAMCGGLAAIINPEQPLGMPIEALNNSPFHNYFIPGILLFAVIGLGNIFSALMLRYKSRFQGYTSSIFSGALVIWIVIQCIMLNAIAFLHILFFALGLTESVLSIMILFEQRLFPTKLILNIYKGIRKNY